MHDLILAICDSSQYMLAKPPLNLITGTVRCQLVSGQEVNTAS